MTESQKLLVFGQVFKFQRAKQRILGVSPLRGFLVFAKSHETQYQRILALGEITKSFKSLKASKPEKVLFSWFLVRLGLG